MKNEIQRHKKSDGIKWAVISLAVILLAVAVTAAITQGFRNWNPYGWFNEQEQTTPDNNSTDNELNIVPENVNSAMRLAATPMVTNDSTSYTITATISPASASNQAVDWTVEWADSSNIATVTDYIVVAPSTDGSKTATVTCKQSFEGTIFVIATVRNSNITARCMVSFVGKPTDLNVSTSIPLSNGYYEIPSTGTKYIDLVLNNAFNSVGADYGNYTVSVVKSGSVKYGTKTQNFTTGAISWGTLSTTNFADYESKCDVPFVEFRISGSRLNVICNGGLAAGCSTVNVGSNSITVYDAFNSEVSKCYYTVTVTENLSNLAVTFKVGFSSSFVSGVTLDKTTITF